MLKRLGRLGFVVLAVAVGTLTGCSHQEFNRPYQSWITDFFDSGEPYLDPGKSPDELRSDRLSHVLSAWQSTSEVATGEYMIGAGDLLDVGVFALESPDRTTTVKCPVSQEGFIVLPWIGRVAAAGRSAPELADQIKASYADRYILDPQVSVKVAEFRSASVIVTGAVAKPGVYYLTERATPLLAILGKAGGLTSNAGSEVVIVRTGNPAQASERSPSPLPRASDTSRPADQELGEAVPAMVRVPGEQVIRIDLRDLLEDGNPLFNVGLINGDVVSVPSTADRQVHVLGYVNRPGAVSVRGHRVGALRAVAMAGGLTPTARAENSYVVRETTDREKADVVRVDLTKIARGVRPPLYLQIGDTLVVGSDVIARLSEFIRPSAGASASYALGAP